MKKKSFFLACFWNVLAFLFFATSFPQTGFACISWCEEPYCKKQPIVPNNQIPRGAPLERTYFAQKRAAADIVRQLPDRTGLADLEARQVSQFSVHDALALHKPGTTVNSYVSEPGSVFSMNVGNISGKAQTWKVPDIQFGTVNTIRNVAPANTPNGKMYSDATHAVKITDAVSRTEYYEYYQLYDKGFLLMGAGSAADLSKSMKPTPQGICPLPLDLGTTLYECSDLYQVSAPKGVQNAEKKNCVYMGVEGFGTLVTPDDGPVSAIKVAVVNEYETFHDGKPAGTTVVRKYFWYTEKGHKLEVTLADGAPALGNTKVTHVVYESLLSAEKRKEMKKIKMSKKRIQADVETLRRFSKDVSK